MPLTPVATSSSGLRPEWPVSSASSPEAASSLICLQRKARCNRNGVRVGRARAVVVVKSNEEYDCVFAYNMDNMSVVPEFRSIGKEVE